MASCYSCFAAVIELSSWRSSWNSSLGGFYALLYESIHYFTMRLSYALLFQIIHHDIMHYSIMHYSIMQYSIVHVWIIMYLPTMPSTGSWIIACSHYTGKGDCETEFYLWRVPKSKMQGAPFVTFFISFKKRLILFCPWISLHLKSSAVFLYRE